MDVNEILKGTTVFDVTTTPGGGVQEITFYQGSRRIQMCFPDDPPAEISIGGGLFREISDILNDYPKTLRCSRCGREFTAYAEYDHECLKCLNDQEAIEEKEWRRNHGH